MQALPTSCLVVPRVCHVIHHLRTRPGPTQAPLWLWAACGHARQHVRHSGEAAARCCKQGSRARKAAGPAAGRPRHATSAHPDAVVHVLHPVAILVRAVEVAQRARLYVARLGGQPGSRDAGAAVRSGEEPAGCGHQSACQQPSCGRFPCWPHPKPAQEASVCTLLPFHAKPANPLPFLLPAHLSTSQKLSLPAPCGAYTRRPSRPSRGPPSRV